MTADPRQSGRADELGDWNITPTYLIGVYLAVNAIPDAALLVDGPGCVTTKGLYVHGLHDIASTLLESGAHPRVGHTGVRVTDTIATNVEVQIANGIQAMATAPGCRVLLLSSLPMCTLVGTDYDRIIAQCAPATGTPVFNLPGQSLSRDSFDGYAATLEVLARQMDLGGASPQAEQVAVVGHFMHRNEGDGSGNVAELRRLLGELGLKPATIWLSGEPYEQLRAARHAGTIVSLPHGRRAAEILAERTGAQLVHTAVPFGLEGTRRWLEAIARGTGRQAQADRLVQRELDWAIPRLQWTVARELTGLKAAYVGDPVYGRAWLGLLQELGAKLPWMFLEGHPEHLDEELPAVADGGPAVEFAPTAARLQRWWEAIRDDAGMLVANGPVLDGLRPSRPWIEWGYPSMFFHTLEERPFLGFRGAVHLVSDLARARKRVPWAEDSTRPRPRPAAALTSEPPQTRTTAEASLAELLVPVDAIAVLPTFRCNLACQYCHRPPGQPRMTVADAKAAVDLLFERGDTKKSLGFFGGEPLLEFETIRAATDHALARAAERKLPLQLIVATNGALLDQDKVDYLREHDFQVVVSLNGTPEQHDRQRTDARGAGSYRLLEDNLDLLAQIHPDRLSYSYGIYPDNLGSLLEDFTTITDHGFRSINICSIYGAQWTEQAIAELERGYEAVLAHCLEQAGQGNYIVLHNIGLQIRRFTGRHIAYQCGTEASHCPLTFRLAIYPGGQYMLQPYCSSESLLRYRIGSLRTGFDAAYRGCQWDPAAARCQGCLKELFARDHDYAQEYMKHRGTNPEHHRRSEYANELLCDGAPGLRVAEEICRRAQDDATFAGYRDLLDRICDLVG